MTDQVESAESRVPEQNAGFSLDWVRIFWRRKLLVLLGLIAGIIFGAFYYAQSPIIYESGCQVLLIKKRPETVPGANNLLEFQDQLATHQALIRSAVLVERAVKKRNLASLPSFGGGDPSGAIIGSLTATKSAPGSGSQEIMGLSYRGSNPEDCAKILNAVAETYREFLQETYQNISEDTLAQMTQAGQQLHSEISKKEKEYREFRAKSPGVVWRSKDGSDLRQGRLIAIEGRRSVLVLRKAEVEVFLRAVEDGLKKGTSREVLASMLLEWNGKLIADSNRGELARDPKEQLVDLLGAEQRLLGEYGPDHPQVQALRRNIDVVQRLASLPASAYHRVSKLPNLAPKPGDPDPLDVHVEILKEELNKIEFAERALAELYQQEMGQIRQLDDFQFQDEGFRNDIVRSQQLYDSIIKRLQEIDINKTAGGYDARIISWAKPGGKVAPKMLPSVMPGILLGLLLGAGLAYLAEFMDQSFRTPEEVRQRLGLPVVGHIPASKVEVVAAGVDDAEPVGPHPTLVAFHRPKSTLAEAFRGVRTSLYFSTQGEGHKVIQVTSPNQGDGKSTVIANLAISIAQSGRKVILIDADLRRPRLHKLLGVASDKGLSQVVAGTCEFADAVQDTKVVGLALLACGVHPDNPAELLTSPRFKELLDMLRDKYDFVLVDTPPLLAVSDPSVVAPRVDGVMLVVRISKNGRPDAVRAREILTTMGAHVLGVIVNGVGQGSTGGYSYYYGYDSYAYGYSSYGYNSNSSYYEEDQPEEGSDPPQAGEAKAKHRRTGGHARRRKDTWVGKVLNRLQGN